MKYLLLLISFAFVVGSSSLLAQGNLQFNQVINQSFTGPTVSGSTVFGTITVPAGKVWKVERVSLSADYGGGSLSPTTSSSYYAYIGDYLVYNAGTAGQSLFPLWLSEGTYNVSGFMSNGPNFNVSISAIEFNVTP